MWGAAKAIKNIEKVIRIRPETKWANHDQVDVCSTNYALKTEPTSVEKYGVELWLGVKG